MHATQPATFAEHGNLIASLQSIQRTAQAQTERFQHQLALVNVLAGRVQDGARIALLGDISLSLHRVHTLLFGGASPAPEQAALELPAAADNDLPALFAEFSALLDASQGNALQVDTLLAQTEAQLAQLQAAAG